MGLEFLPLLAEQRALLDTARGFERFQRYLDSLVDESGEIRLPLAAFNPMSKPHVATLLDQLIAEDAEGAARAALVEAGARLGPATPDVRVGLVIVDDALGGWTNRYLTDLDHRIDASNELKRGFATAYIWTGEATTAATVRAEVLSVIYRQAYKRRHGLPRSLRQILIQEGLVSTFAGAAIDLAPPLLEQARAVSGQHLDTIQTPITFACLYGDEAAISVGYPPLGVPAWGGLAVAASWALGAAWDPCAALTAAPPEMPADPR
jgi:hypothetical protein